MLVGLALLVLAWLDYSQTIRMIPENYKQGSIFH